jgi:hypothetical protein
MLIRSLTRAMSTAPKYTLYTLSATAAKDLPSHSMHVNKTKTDFA